MKALTSLAATLALLAGTATAQVAPADEAHAKFVTDGQSNVPGATANARLLIDAIDVPLTPETLEMAGVTEAEVAALAADPSARRYTRVRAVGALGVIGTDSARRLIELMAVGDADPQVRVQAVVSLSRIWGVDDRVEVIRFLTERLGDAPVQVDDAIVRELDRLHR